MGRRRFYPEFPRCLLPPNVLGPAPIRASPGRLGGTVVTTARTSDFAIPSSGGAVISKGTGGTTFKYREGENVIWPSPKQKSLKPSEPIAH